jgi:outer membrane murein-binding lipoprotein Lpp
MAEKIIGKKYKVKQTTEPDWYEVGDIVTLLHDDDSKRPFFRNDPRRMSVTHCGLTGCWIHMDAVELLPESLSEKVAQLEKELAQTKQEVANLETKLAQAKQELERVKPKLKLWQTLNVGDMVQVRAAIQVNGQFEATENVGEFWVDAIVFWVEPIGYSGRLPVHVKIGNISIWIGKDDFRLKFNN